jgi:uncharacterized iron-regulated membrane protein
LQAQTGNHELQAHRGGGASRGRKGALQPDLDSAFAAVAAGHPGWRTITLRFEPGQKDSLAFTADDGDGGHPAAKTQVVVTMVRDAELELHETPFTAQPKGQRWRTWVRFTHTGEAAGWAGETIAFVSALGACILAFTGLRMFVPRLLRTKVWTNNLSKHGIVDERTVD